MGRFAVPKKKKKKVFGCFGNYFLILKGDFYRFYRYHSIKAKLRLNKIKKGMPPISPNQTFNAV
ncbi:hypothetical protein HpMS54_11140 [Helicobacter pylori]